MGYGAITWTNDTEVVYSFSTKEELEKLFESEKTNEEIFVKFHQLGSNWLALLNVRNNRWRLLACCDKTVPLNEWYKVIDENGKFIKEKLEVFSRISIKTY